MVMMLGAEVEGTSVWSSVNHPQSYGYLKVDGGLEHTSLSPLLFLLQPVGESTGQQ